MRAPMRARFGIVVFMLVCAIGSNVFANIVAPDLLHVMPVIGMALWGALLVAGGDPGLDVVARQGRQRHVAGAGHHHALAVASDAARAWRRSLRQAGRHAGHVDETLVLTYLAGHPVRRLHIGCGPHLLDGWLNADYEPRARSVLCLDATCRFPLPSNSFDTVFSEHMIEHVPHAGGAVMLSEIFRVLRPGGRVRITPVMPSSRGPAYDPGPQPAVIDIESWRLLNASCPSR